MHIYARQRFMQHALLPKHLRVLGSGAAAGQHRQHEQLVAAVDLHRHNEQCSTDRFAEGSQGDGTQQNLTYWPAASVRLLLKCFFGSPLALQDCSCQATPYRARLDVVTGDHRSKKKFYQCVDVGMHAAVRQAAHLVGLDVVCGSRA